MEFLDHLIRRSDIKQEREYFSYKPSPRRPRSKPPEKVEYERLDNSPLVEDYVVFDLETTGLSPGINAIVEIGGVKVLGGKVTDSFSRLVNPGQYIPAYLSEKIHITNAMVQDKPTIEAVLLDFIRFIHRDGQPLPLVAHNAPFDMGFLIRNCRALGININNPVINTLTLGRRHLKECDRYNLEYLARYYHIDLTNAHRAYYDAKATQRIFEIIKERIRQEDTDV